MLKPFVLAAATCCFTQVATAQTPSAPLLPADLDDTPWATVRLHTGPNLNLMGDWRDGMTALQDLARQNGLSSDEKTCICMSWGAAALAHVTPRLAVGGQFEMLRDTRSFTVDDELHFFGSDQRTTFGFTNETVVRTTQAIAAFYPREASRVHVQVGAGLGTGHTTMSTPGGDAAGRVRGWLFTTSIGTEAKFWYVDAGWRFHRMRTLHTSFTDNRIDEARDVFDSAADVEAFVRDREVDFTGGWIRIGLALHFGRR